MDCCPWPKQLKTDHRFWSMIQTLEDGLQIAIPAPSGRKQTTDRHPCPRQLKTDHRSPSLPQAAENRLQIVILAACVSGHKFLIQTAEDRPRWKQLSSDMSVNNQAGQKTDGWRMLISVTSCSECACKTTVLISFFPPFLSSFSDCGNISSICLMCGTSWPGAYCHPRKENVSQVFC